MEQKQNADKQACANAVREGNCRQKDTNGLRLQCEKGLQTMRGPKYRAKLLKSRSASVRSGLVHWQDSEFKKKAVVQMV